MKKYTFILAVLALVLLTACNNKNVTFNGFEKGTSKYRTDIKVSGGTGRANTVLRKSDLGEHQIFWKINIKDSTICEATILRIRSKITRAGLFDYIFDTDLDTVNIQSKLGGGVYSENPREKETMLKELDFLKRLRNVHFVFSKEKNKKLQLDVNLTIDLDEYPYSENSKLLIFLIDFFNTNNLATLFDYVFYPEVGTFQKDSIYEKPWGKFRYTKEDHIEYWENKHTEEESCSVNTDINPGNNQLIESVFYRKRILEKQKNRFDTLTLLRIEDITTKPVK